MKTIETKMPFCKSVSRWATLWLLAFGMFLAACDWLAPRVLAQTTYEPYTFTTLAGNAGYGSDDGTGSAARFNYPHGVSVDSAGNVYVADTRNNTIRKATPTGVVTTLAGLAGVYGSTDGTGSDARFSGPSGVAVDSAGNVYVADSFNYTIRKVTPLGVVTALAGLAGSPGRADGTGSTARFSGPSGVAVDSAGNVYVADTDNNTIRKVTPAGVVTTLAGLAQLDADGFPVRGSMDGTGSAAQFDNPHGVAVDSSGNVYVADEGNQTIRKVTPKGVVTTLAGLAGNHGSADGTGSAARFGRPFEFSAFGPTGVAVDNEGTVYVADSGNNTIRKVTSTGVVTTLAGVAPLDVDGNIVEGSYGSADGTGSEARFNYPSAVAVDSAGNVYVADTGNSSIRKVTSSRVVTTLAGLAGGYGDSDGTGSDARFWNPSGVAVDRTGNVYVADTAYGTIRKVTPTGVVTTLAGAGSDVGLKPSGVAVDSEGNVYVPNTGNTIRKVTTAGVVTTLAGLALRDVNGNYVAESIGSADGTGSAARFSSPSGVAVDSAGNVYVADTRNFTIRKVTPAGVVTTLAGLAGYIGSRDGTGSAARFVNPVGVAVDSARNVYVTDTANNTIRKVTPDGMVTTLAGLPQFDQNGTPVGGSADGTGSAARFNIPSGVAVDSAGNVYVADTGNSSIRKVTPAGEVTTLAGSPGSAEGTGSDARFSGPRGVAVDSAGNVYVADTDNNTIRKGYPSRVILTSGPGFGFNGGQFGFNLSGPLGRLVVVEASTDLVNWLPIWTNTFTGALNFSDPQLGVYSNRFYRAHTP